jgi:CO/xanthine dehydrogenase FAD-binding subunit
VRNLATVGGNLAHGDPANDHPATMLALGAEVVAVGPRGECRIPVNSFFTGRFPPPSRPMKSSWRFGCRVRACGVAARISSSSGRSVTSRRRRSRRSSPSAPMTRASERGSGSPTSGRPRSEPSTRRRH